MSRKIILVLGMHRSGTSAIARGVVALGASSGGNLLLPDESNAKGYWENSDIVKLNDRMLNLFNMKWYSLDNVSLNRFKTFLPFYQEQFIEDAIKIIDRDYASYNTIMIKDPRISILLPFWNKVFERLNAEVKYIITVRNPLEVANSLKKRNNMQIEYGIKLWIYYNFTLLNNIDSDFLLCDFNKIILNPEIEINRIGEYIENKNTEKNIYEYCNDFLDNSLVHNKFSNSSFEKIFDEDHVSNSLNAILNSFAFEKVASNIKAKEFVQMHMEQVIKYLEEKEQSDYDDYAQVFINDGKGYSEVNSYKYINKTNHYIINLSFDKENSISELRIDPSRYSCMLRINSIILNNGYRQADVDSYFGNYDYKLQDIYIFENIDPQFIIKPFHSNINEIRINYFVYPMDKFTIWFFNQIKNKSIFMLNAEILKINSELEQNNEEINNKNNELIEYIEVIKNMNNKLEQMSQIFKAKDSELEKVKNEIRDKNEVLERTNEEMENRNRQISLKDYEINLKNLQINNLNKIINDTEAYEIISNSMLFDENFYLNENIDVKYSGIDPCKHYIDYGARENRNPSIYFDTKYYTSIYDDISLNIINPLYHYIKHGYKENRQFINPDKVLEIFKEAVNRNTKNKIIKIIKNLKICYGIFKSGYYDTAYYIYKYPDFCNAVSKSFWSKYRRFFLKPLRFISKFFTHPVFHYVFYGVYEGKELIKDFDSKYYLSHQSDVLINGINPLYHYITCGNNEGRKGRNSKTEEVKSVRAIYDIKKNIGNNFEIEKDSAIIDIVIPVYNGFEYLKSLFISIKKNTLCKYRLIIVNDCSTDDRVEPFLSEIIKEFKSVILINNDKNLGFVKTVNKASKYTENDFVLLNTDVIVPRDWLIRLMRPILESNDIATTTPFSNAATVLSFPIANVDNSIDINNLALYDDVFKRLTYDYCDSNLDIPTGVGFCMGVRKSVWEQIGGFDEETFSLGYGEENDFCQRAIKNGYRNIYVPNLYVFHNHGGSFESEKKKKLLERNLELLNEKHPNYHYDIAKWIAQNPTQIYRDTIILLLFKHAKQSNIIFDHGHGGGAGDYLYKTLIPKIKENGSYYGVCTPVRDSECKGVYLSINAGEIETKIVFNDVYELSDFMPRNVFINELALWHYDVYVRLIELLIKLDVNITMLFHDFYPICPTINLMTNEDIFCGLPEEDECVNCIKNNKYNRVKIKDIKKWRNEWQKIFAKAERLIFFSENTKKLTAKIFDMDESKLEIYPHMPLITYDDKQKYILNKDSDLVVGFIGAIGLNKGLKMILKMAKIAHRSNKDIKIIIIGYIDPDYQRDFDRLDNVTITGPYERDELPMLLKNNNVKISVIASVWPETFCYVLQELMLLNYPVVSFDIGAQGERTKMYKYGQVANALNAESLLETVIALDKKLEEMY